MKRYKFYTTVGIIETNNFADKHKYILHREDGPAFIEYRHDGRIDMEEWYINNNRHREDGPAFIGCREDGSVWCAYWYWHGMLHREDYTKPANTYSNRYYWYGVECEPDELLDKNFRDRIMLKVLG